LNILKLLKIIIKKTFYYFNPRISFGWSSFWYLYKDECHVDEIQIHEVTVTDTDGQATLCHVKTTRRNKLDAVQYLSVIDKRKLRNACILNKSSCMRALAFRSDNLDCIASQQLMQYEVFNCYDRANPPSRDGRS